MTRLSNLCFLTLHLQALISRGAGAKSLVPRDQQAKRSIIRLARWTAFIQWDRKEYGWHPGNTRASLGTPQSNLDGKWRSTAVMAREEHCDQGLRSFRDKSLGNLPGKPHGIAEVLSMGERNLEWVVQEGDDQYQ